MVGDIEHMRGLDAETAAVFGGGPTATRQPGQVVESGHGSTDKRLGVALIFRLFREMLYPLFERQPHR